MNRKEWHNRKGRSSKWINKTVRLAIYHRDNFRCVYCFQPKLKDYNGETLTLDHIVPRSKGGSDLPTNLVTACVGCNSSRQQRSHGANVMRRLQRHLDRPLNMEVGKVLRELCKLVKPENPAPLSEYLEERSAVQCLICGGHHMLLECPHRPETD